MADKEKHVFAVFRERGDGERAFDYLRSQGYTHDDIHVMISDETRARYYGDDKEAHPVGTHATEGAAVGGAVGAATGATLAAVAAVGTSLAIPGLGLVVAGPVAAALAGAGAGAVAGGLVGALVGLGIPESNAEAYEAALKDGGIVLGVEPKSSDDVDDIKEKFEDFNGENICYC